MHHSSGGGRLSFFFEVTDWHGEIQNRERRKCKSLTWYPLENLPSRLVPYTRDAIIAYLHEDILSCREWSRGLPNVTSRRRSITA
jgi:hypothetical protein